MSKKRHYQIVKYIVCDLSGEICGDVQPIDSRCMPECEKCDWYAEDKISREV